MLPEKYTEALVLRDDNEYYRVTSQGRDSPVFYGFADDVVILGSDDGYESEREGGDGKGEDPKDGNYNPERCVEKGEHIMFRPIRACRLWST